MPLPKRATAAAVPLSPPAPPIARAASPTDDDEGAVDWDDAVRRHGRRVVVSLLALGLPFHEAEEMAQRAWARLIEKHRAGALPVVTLPGLAIAQARFLALSERRAQAKNAGAAPLELVVLDEERGDARLIDGERLARVLAALASCSPTARRVFAALLLRDPPPSHAEVAAEVGLSVQRVRQTLCEVRKILRRAEENTAP